jgi:SAM-dependent methyltransferase
MRRIRPQNFWSVIVLYRIAHAFKSVIASLYWLATMGRWGVQGVFDTLYAGQVRSEKFREIYRGVFGADYAEEADPTGYMTMTDLANIVKHLQVGSGQQFVDLACGRGGGSLWVARATGATLLGIDISPVAIQAARDRIAAFGVTGKAKFEARDITATRCPDASFDGAMSVDALFLVPDKTGAVREAARILKPGARFVFTTWELDEPFRVKDYRPLLAEAGFEVESLDETPDWERRQRAILEQSIAAKDQLTQEMGPEAATMWVHYCETELPKLPLMRRILVVARKRAA